MVDTRKKDINWMIIPGSDGRVSYDDAKLAVLMDIRDELKALNRLLGCYNFTSIPEVLRSIRGNTSRIRRPRK